MRPQSDWNYANLRSQRYVGKSTYVRIEGHAHVRTYDCRSVGAGET
jgi:hypothetical protein